jgi:hypothetical protein
MMSVPDTMMAAGAPEYGPDGGSGGGSAVMSRSRLNIIMPTPVVKAPKLDDGGDGGDIGKINRNGGGGGGGDDDDDDDYFGEGDDEGNEGEGAGEGFLRAVIPESYDKFSISAVLQEWMKTIAELPLVIRRAVEMGLFSSAQLVRFMSMDVRPGITRAVTRSLPPSLAREMVGRLMADPGFVQKMVVETSVAACASLCYEYQARGERFKDELDLVLINTLGLALATGATSWMLAPCRSYGAVHKFPWQQALDSLPNCVFDASGPLRHYSVGQRAASVFVKMAELSAVGAVMGVTTSALSAAAVDLHKRNDPSYSPSIATPDISHSMAGMAAYFALNANARYQVVGGLDRFLFQRCNYLWTYMGISMLTRGLSTAVGEMSRPWMQGLPKTTQRKRVVKKKVIKRRRAAEAAPVAAAAAVAATPAVMSESPLSLESLAEPSTTASPDTLPVSISSEAAPTAYAVEVSAPDAEVAGESAAFPQALQMDSVPADSIQQPILPSEYQISESVQLASADSNASVSTEQRA